MKKFTRKNQCQIWAGRRISKLKDRKTENYLIGGARKKEENQQWLRYLWTTHHQRYQHMHHKKRKGQEKIFEETMAKNFPNTKMKHTSKNPTSSNQIKPKIFKPRHLIIKLWTSKLKRELSKYFKWLIMSNGSSRRLFRLSAYFSSETCEMTSLVVNKKNLLTKNSISNKKLLQN